MRLAASRASGSESINMPPYIVPESSVDSVVVSDGTKTLLTRASTQTAVAGGKGVINPDHINMQGLLALFAILGAAFVMATIWFFFWAKNGGCVFRKGDWDDYKSTVLRRKGPDGRTLSNATTSTNLGGGTVRGYDDDGLTYTDMTETATEFTNEKSMARGGRKKNKKNFKETAKEKLLRKTKDEKWEGEADEDMRAYRQEKPARVGGLNREAEGTYYGTEYTPSSLDSHSQPAAKMSLASRRRKISFATQHRIVETLVANAESVRSVDLARTVLANSSPQTIAHLCLADTLSHWISRLAVQIPNTSIRPLRRRKT